MKSKFIILTVVASLLIATTAAPISAQSEPVSTNFENAFDGTLSAELQQEVTFLDSTTTLEDAVRYDGNPSVYVRYENDSVDDLTTWANGSEERQIIAYDNASRRALVAAPLDDLGLTGLDRVLSRGLSGLSYVESISLNRQVSYAEPFRFVDNESAYTDPSYAHVVEYTNGGDQFTAEGQAWSGDANESTTADVRENISAAPSDVSVNGSGVTVAVIDTGVNVFNETNDPLYGNRTVNARNTITDESGLDAVEDGNGHGSWVAGAIAANPDTSVSGEAHEGVAPGVTIMPIKALSDSGSGSTQDIVEGIEWARTHDADVISMSLGSPVYSPAIAQELEEFLQGSGTAVFVAVGNSKHSATGPATRYISSPADVEGVLGVAATNTAAPENATPAYFSEVGPDNGVTDASNGVTVDEGPDLAAPGMKVTAAVLDANGLRQNETLSGTSMATPYAAGVGALMLDADSSLKNDTVAFNERIRATASPVPNAGVTEVGHGMVNAANATSNTEPDTDQESARTDEARARDVGNRAYSSSWVVRTLVTLSGDAE